VDIETTLFVVGEIEVLENHVTAEFAKDTVFLIFPGVEVLPEDRLGGIGSEWINQGIISAWSARISFFG
jgi:hypothetical protein